MLSIEPSNSGFSESQALHLFNTSAASNDVEIHRDMIQYCWQQMLDQYVEVEREYLRLEAQQKLAEGLSRNELKQEIQEAENRRNELKEAQKKEVHELVEWETEVEEVAERYTKYAEKEKQYEEKKIRMGEKHQAKIEWYETIQQQMTALSRTKLVRWEDNLMEWVIIPRTVATSTPVRPASLETEYVLHVRLVPDSDDIDSICLIPDNVPIDDICAHIRKVSGIENLLYEVKCRINNSLKRRSEISSLARRYAVASPSPTEVAVTFANGFSCSFILDPDYPRAYTHIFVASIDYPSSVHKVTTEKLREQINSNAAKTSIALPTLVGGLEKCLNQLLQKENTQQV